MFAVKHLQEVPVKQIVKDVQMEQVVQALKVV